MAILFLATSILAALVVVWAIVSILQGRLNKQARLVYFGCFIAAAIAAYFTTYQYNHYPNANTRFRGWPIPWLIEQRDSPSSPWLDFIGPLIVLAYPINLVIYLLLPSIVALLVVDRLFARAPPPQA